MSDAVLRWWHPPGLPQTQTLTGSPSTYTNLSAGLQIYAQVGGIVTLTELDLGAGFVVSLLSVFTLAPNQSVRVTYAVAPVVTTVQL